MSNRRASLRGAKGQAPGVGVEGAAGVGVEDAAGVGVQGAAGVGVQGAAGVGVQGAAAAPVTQHTAQCLQLAAVPLVQSERRLLQARASVLCRSRSARAATGDAKGTEGGEEGRGGGGTDGICDVFLRLCEVDVQALDLRDALAKVLQ
jgi:hypothetical protein